MARFISPITDMKPNGSVNFLDATTNLDKITYKNELETIPNDLSVKVNANGNLAFNVFFSGSATAIYLDEFNVQYASRSPVGEEVGIGNFTGWSANIIYSNPDITIGSNDKFYLSITSGNQDNDPTTDEVNWEEIRFIGVWNTNITYDIGIVVQTTDGILWRSLTATAGNNPSADDGTNWSATTKSFVSDQPTNVSPADAATDVSTTPTLTSSAYSGTDTQLFAIYRVYLADGVTEVYNSGASDDLNNHVVPESANLLTQTEYKWSKQDVGVSSISTESALTSFIPKVDISSFFQTTLYTGNGSAQSIISDLDFTANDGLVWTKSRSASNAHSLMDTVRGLASSLSTDSGSGEITATSQFITSFNDDGYSIGNNASYNTSSALYVAWQFMKEQGFFDVVEYTGNGSGSRTVAIDLDDGGSAEFGMVFLKNLDGVGSWPVQHRSLGGTKSLVLDTTAAEGTISSFFNNTNATTTILTLGSSSQVNGSGDRYIAYVFAHNPSKGIFCDSYTGTGAAGNKQTLDIGVIAIPILKSSSTTGDWDMSDNERNPTNPVNKVLRANTNAAEVTLGAGSGINFLSDGFDFEGAENNVLGVTYVFCAIGTL